MRNRYWPTALGLLAAVVLGWYLLYTELLMREMRRDARVHSRIYITILRGLNDPREGSAEQTLFTLSDDVQDLGIPIVVTDADGIPAYTSNLPFAADPNNPDDFPRLAAYLRRLERTQPAAGGAGDRDHLLRRSAPGGAAPLDPLVPGRGTHLPARAPRRSWSGTTSGWSGSGSGRPWRGSRRTRWRPRSPRSPGWVEILRLPPEEREEMASLPVVSAEMEADLDRLEKVARRFEWIGRPVRREAVDIRALLRQLERYVRVRMPQLARNVELELDVVETLPPVLGNAVLLEWAFENLLKNALDAPGRGPAATSRFAPSASRSGASPS